MVSCTSTTDGVTPPAVAAKDQTAQAVSGEVAGAPTLSPNAHAVMSVTDPLGDKTPVPMYTFTPAPSPTPVTPVPTRPAATTVADESALATTMAERDPRIMTQEGAQEGAPFHIQKAEYVAEGYELDQWVNPLEGLSYDNEVKGVYMRYVPIGLKPFPFPHEMMVNQYLAEDGTPPGGLTPSAPEDVGGFEAQVYEIPEVGVIQLYCRDPERGVIFDIVSPFDKEETLRIVRSFQ